MEEFMSLRLCILSVLLSTLLTSNVAQAEETCRVERSQGRDVAKEQKSWPWLLYGAGGVIVMGFPGGVITSLVGAAIPPKVGEELISESDCFLQGYKRKTRWIRFNRAMLGAIPLSMAVSMTTSAALAAQQTD